MTTTLAQRSDCMMLRIALTFPKRLMFHAARCTEEQVLGLFFFDGWGQKCIARVPKNYIDWVRVVYSHNADIGNEIPMNEMYNYSKYRSSSTK